MIDLGTKCYKNNFDSKLYSKMADFCNSSNNKYTIDEKSEYYEIVEYVKPQLSYKEQLEREMEILKHELSKSDYEAIKYSEGWFTDEEYAPIKAERESLREKIRTLESQLNN